MDDTKDVDLVEKMRESNLVQLETLCKMHLSFEIDLELDNNENTTDRKPKLWNKFQRKTKACTSASIASLCAATTLTQTGLDGLSKLIHYLEKEENITQEGIFRKTGSVARQNELKLALMDIADLDLNNWKCINVHDVASVLKTILSELDEPLLTLNYYSAYQQVADAYNSKGMRDDRLLLNSLQLLFILIPRENRTLLQQIIRLLHSTIKHEAKNKMNADNLSTLFTPHLVCPRNLPSEALMEQCNTFYGMISFMIKTGEAVFQIPIKLATDIKAYFVEQNRRKTMSPEQMLNESIASETTANTVFTFVDHKRTAEAHGHNTDTALAELYAYIQSLPESSRKKKLIKQFNRENGHGTPLQLLNVRRDKNSGGLLAKTIGSSIKKHIFTKGFLSKTPKRTDTPVTSFVKTPNKTNLLPVQRNLFVQLCDKPSSSSNVNNTVNEKDIMHKERDLSVLTNLNPSKLINGRSMSETCLNKIDSCKPQSINTRSLSVGDIPKNYSTLSCLDMGDRLSGNTTPERTNYSLDPPLLSPIASKMLANTCSTPATYLGRQSMSPITKSTKRMPKAMQESIMTPRSRKPITAIESLTETKSIGFESLLEESSELNSPILNTEPIVYHVEQPKASLEHYSIAQVLNEDPGYLSETFKEYLINRNLHTDMLPPPEDDDSFSSQPDDFVSSTDLKDLSETNMSESFLYCMNGNDPDISGSNKGRKRILMEQNNLDLGDLYEPQTKKVNGNPVIGETTL